MTQPQTRLLIADRRIPGAADDIRSAFSQVVDPTYGKWLAEAKCGPFLVVTIPAMSWEEMFVNATSEAALIEVVTRKFIDHGNALGLSAPFLVERCWVTPELDAKLRRLFEEIEHLLAHPEVPGPGENPPPPRPKLRVVK